MYKKYILLPCACMITLVLGLGVLCSPCAASDYEQQIEEMYAVIEQQQNGAVDYLLCLADAVLKAVVNLEKCDREDTLCITQSIVDIFQDIRLCSAYLAEGVAAD
ncbi:hypothetical protein ACFL43_04545 [Thermodesulfobacteriota bacterium]